MFNDDLERNDAAKEDEALIPADASEQPAVTETAPEEEDPLTVKFSKPYRFEDSTYDGIDLSGLERLNAMDMCAAEKHLNRSGMFSPLPEMAAEYVCYIATQVTDQPIEFFKHLPPKDFIKVKNRITNFFFGEG